jgi:hypothetical protein
MYSYFGVKKGNKDDDDYKPSTSTGRVKKEKKTTKATKCTNTV